MLDLWGEVMLINKKENSTYGRVKFISYTGHYPNLCRGILTLEIDGKEVKFGHDTKLYNFKTGRFNDTNYDEFWHSGGYIGKGYVAHQGGWEIDVEKLPKEYKEYAVEIDEVFNANVPYGCCGGCI